jgi:hypothetical protein
MILHPILSVQNPLQVATADITLAKGVRIRSRFYAESADTFSDNRVQLLNNNDMR